MTEKMNRIHRTEHELYHLAEGHVLQLRGEFFTELEAQKAKFLSDQQVIHQLEASVQTATQVCSEYNNQLTETANNLGMRNQELLKSQRELTESKEELHTVVQHHTRAEHIVRKRHNDRRQIKIL